MFEKINRVYCLELYMDHVRLPAQAYCPAQLLDEGAELMTARGKKYPEPCVCATLRMAARAVTQLYDNALRPIGLRATQFQTLTEIRSAGEVTVTGLTRLLLIDQTTLTRNLAVLERDGLLRAVPQADGRVKAVRLTRKGELTLRKAFPLWIATQTQMTNAMGAGTWASLSAELERLAKLPAN